MTPDEYFQRSANIARRIDILRNQVDLHVLVHLNTNNPVIWPAANAHHATIGDLMVLHQEFFGSPPS